MASQLMFDKFAILDGASSPAWVVTANGCEFAFVDNEGLVTHTFERLRFEA
jgi:hypothetical protein